MQNLSYLLPPFTSLIYAVKFSDDELVRRLEYIVSKGITDIYILTCCNHLNPHMRH